MYGRRFVSDTSRVSPTHLVDSFDVLSDESWSWFSSDTTWTNCRQCVAQIEQVLSCNARSSKTPVENARWHVGLSSCAQSFLIAYDIGKVAHANVNPLLQRCCWPNVSHRTYLAECETRCTRSWQLPLFNRFRSSTGAISYAATVCQSNELFCWLCSSMLWERKDAVRRMSEAVSTAQSSRMDLLLVCYQDSIVIFWKCPLLSRRAFSN